MRGSIAIRLVLKLVDEEKIDFGILVKGLVRAEKLGMVSK